MAGTVTRACNARYPNCVLKKGLRHKIRQEADFLRFASHPNIIQYAEIHTDEQSPEGHTLAYLALQRLGPPLYSLLQDLATP